MTQDKDTIFQVDIKWVIGIVVSVLSLNLASIVQLVKLYERLTVVENEVIHLTQVDASRATVSRDLAVLEQKLQFLARNQENIKDVCRANPSP